MDGRALAHHLEPSYYAALEKAIKQAAAASRSDDREGDQINKNTVDDRRGA